MSSGNFQKAFLKNFTIFITLKGNKIILHQLHFKTLNLDERCLYLRHEGHAMKLIFMTPRQASKDQHRLKEKIEKEEI